MLSSITSSYNPTFSKQPLAESKGNGQTKKSKRKESLSQDEKTQQAANLEREKKIDDTIDLVVHDLISKGHLPAGKSYMLKTKEMKEHIGRMHDQLNKRKNEETVSRTSMKRLASRSQSEAVTTAKPIASENPMPIKSTKSNEAKSQQKRAETARLVAAIQKARSVHSNPRTEKLAHISHETGGQQRPTTPYLNEGLKPLQVSIPNAPNDIGRLMANADAAKKSPAVRPHKNVYKKKVSAAVKAPFRAAIDLSGFTNDEITLDIDGRRMTITAQKGKRKDQSVKKLVETLDIPQQVDMQNLKIGRKADGILIVEEFR